MFIHLDTKSLIDLLEHGKPCSINRFDASLRSQNASLVVSWSNVWELADGILRRCTKERSWELFDQLELLPVRYSFYLRTVFLECCEALRCIQADRPFERPCPFTDRFEQVLEEYSVHCPRRSYDARPLRDVVNSICKAVPQALQRIRHAERELKKRLETMENNYAKPRVEGIANYLEASFSLLGLSGPRGGSKAISEIMCRDSQYCPAIQLLYSVWSQMYLNRVNITGGDMLDSDAVACIPYTSFSTVDRRMYDYVGRAGHELSINYRTHVFVHMDDLLTCLASQSKAS